MDLCDLKGTQSSDFATISFTFLDVEIVSPQNWDSQTILRRICTWVPLYSNAIGYEAIGQDMKGKDRNADIGADGRSGWQSCLDPSDVSWTVPVSTDLCKASHFDVSASGTCLLLTEQLKPTVTQYKQAEKKTSNIFCLVGKRAGVRT